MHMRITAELTGTQSLSFSWFNAKFEYNYIPALRPLTGVLEEASEWILYVQASSLQLRFNCQVKPPMKETHIRRKPAQ